MWGIAISSIILAVFLVIIFAKWIWEKENNDTYCGIIKIKNFYELLGGLFFLAVLILVNIATTFALDTSELVFVIIAWLFIVIILAVYLVNKVDPGGLHADRVTVTANSNGPTTSKRGLRFDVA